MSMVRFATTCDHTYGADGIPCGKRSEEYTAWPGCKVCMDQFCPLHQRPDTYDEETNSCLCVDCTPEDLEDVREMMKRYHAAER